MLGVNVVVYPIRTPSGAFSCGRSGKQSPHPVRVGKGGTFELGVAFETEDGIGTEIVERVEKVASPAHTHLKKRLQNKALPQLILSGRYATHDPLTSSDLAASRSLMPADRNPHPCPTCRLQACLCVWAHAPRVATRTLLVHDFGRTSDTVRLLTQAIRDIAVVPHGAFPAPVDPASQLPPGTSPVGATSGSVRCTAASTGRGWRAYPTFLTEVITDPF